MKYRWRVFALVVNPANRSKSQTKLNRSGVYYLNPTERLARQILGYKSQKSYKVTKRTHDDLTFALLFASDRRRKAETGSAGFSQALK